LLRPGKHRSRLQRQSNRFPHLQAREPWETSLLRVRSQLLDRMVNQAGEILIGRSRLGMRVSQLRASLGDMGANLERLRGQLRDLELQAESPDAIAFGPPCRSERGL